MTTYRVRYQHGHDTFSAPLLADEYHYSGDTRTRNFQQALASLIRRRETMAADCWIEYSETPNCGPWEILADDSAMLDDVDPRSLESDEPPYGSFPEER